MSTTSDERRHGVVTRRDFLYGAGGLSAGLILAASGSSAYPDLARAATKHGRPVPGGTLTISFYADNQGSIDPNQVYWLETRTLCRNLADSLTDQDPNTGDIKPWLAESWTINHDASVYTFRLRKGVTFSDGTPLDATAVKIAMDGIVALGPNSILGNSYMTGYKHSTVLDPYTVRITFDGPNAQFLQASSTTTLAILSPGTYKKSPEKRSAGQIVASGLFVLESYVPNQSVKLRRRPDYAWPSSLVKNKGPAYLDGIDVSYVPEDSVRLGNLLAGDLDIDWPRLPIPYADQQRVTGAGDRIVQRSLPGISLVLATNVTKGHILSDIRVRSALNKAIDRKSYASTIFWSGYPVVKSVLDSSTPGWKDESSLLGYDLAAAKAELEQAGWVLGSDGYRHKNGRTLSLDYAIGINSPGPQLLQSQVKRAGIQFNLQVLTPSQTLAREHAGQYDLFEDYFTRGDPSVLAIVFDAALVKGPPATASEAPAVQKRLEAYFAQGLATVNSGKRAAVYGQLQRYMIEQGVALPVYERLQVSGISKNVHGFAWTSEAFMRANDMWKSA